MSANPPLPALQSSVDHLHQLVTGMGDDDLERSAYPTEWTIADVLSHIGSGAVIFLRRLEDSLRGQSVPDDFAPGVWDAWNAKSPTEQGADALVADRQLTDRITEVSAGPDTDVKFSLGPLTFDLAGLTGLRLNEHALHTWDVEVALDPSATVQRPAVGIIVDNLELIARFTGKPTGTTRSPPIHVPDPDRDFAIQLTPAQVTFEAGASGPGDP